MGPGSHFVSVQKSESEPGPIYGPFTTIYVPTLIELRPGGLLRDDILTLARTGIVSPGQPSPYGRKFELDGILTVPSGRSAAVRTVWIFRPEEQLPRFVTALPR